MTPLDPLVDEPFEPPDQEPPGRGTKTPGLAKDTHESLPADRLLQLDLEAYVDDFNARVIGAYSSKDAA